MEKTGFIGIVLSAGKGLRMKTPLPKALHPVAGTTMLERVVVSCVKAGAEEVRVVVPRLKSELFSSIVEPLGAVCFKQAEALGTADAVSCAQIDRIEDDSIVMILNSDHPLIEQSEIEKLINEFLKSENEFCVVTANTEKPEEYGRIVRDSQNQIRSIVEFSEATYDSLQIKEVNTGCYILYAYILKQFLKEVCKGKKLNEVCFTDMVSLSVENNKKVGTLSSSENFALGVNSQKQLQNVQKKAFVQNVEKLIDEGVTVIDPQNTYIEDSVSVGSGTVLYPGCYLKKGTQIGNYCVIEPGSFIFNSFIKDHVHIKAGSYIEMSSVDSRSVIGPYAHLRPDCEVGEDCKVGNFVELKKVILGKKSKASHLAYLGDCEVGEEVNIGCGVVTCNYSPDKKKSKTKIGSFSFVGSDSQLIAPVELGKGCVIGAGSVVVENVPDSALYVSRSEHRIKKDYLKDKK